MDVADLWNSALELTVWVGGPFVLTALTVGLLVSIFQAATQLQENVISFAPKIAAVGLLLYFGGTWMLSRLVRYFQEVALRIIEIGQGVGG